MKRVEITSANQILVEGNDVKNFLEAFTDHLGTSGSVQIQNFGGIHELRGFLDAFIRMPGFDTVARIGVVRDAESEADRALQSVQSCLRRVCLPVPDTVEFPSGGSPEVTVLILPGNSQPGMLETLLCKTFEGTSEDTCINDFLGCIPWKIPSNRMPKSRVYAWIATQSEPNVSVGVAAKKGFWNLDHSALDPVRNLLLSLSRP